MSGKAFLAIALLLALVAGVAVVLFSEQREPAPIDTSTQSVPAVTAPPGNASPGSGTSNARAPADVVAPTNPTDPTRVEASGDDYSAAGDLRVTGRVIDAETNKPVAEADVSMHYPDGELIDSTLSEDDGTYELTLHEGIPPSVDFTASADGYSTTLSPGVAITRSQRDVTMDFQLRPGFRIEGRVVGMDGRPIEDATVGIRMQKPVFEDSWDEADTDANGIYSLGPVEDLPADGFDLYCSSPEHAPQVKLNLRLAPNQLVLRVDFQLYEHFVVTGRVVDGGNHGIEGADVNLVSPDPEYVEDGESDSSDELGAFRFEFDTLPLEGLFVLVSADEYGPARIVDVPPPGPDGTIDLGAIQLGQRVHVSGFVVTAGSGRTVGGGDVTIFPAGIPEGADSEYSDTASIDATGRFELDLEYTPVGPAMIAVDPHGGVPVTKPFVIPAGQASVETRVEVDPVIVLSGTISRKTDLTPVSGARLRVLSGAKGGDDDELICRSRPDGRFQLELPATLDTSRLHAVVEYAGRRFPMGELPGTPGGVLELHRDFSIDVPPARSPQMKLPGLPGDPGKQDKR